MSFKSLVCAGVLFGLLVTPVAAQPSLVVDLVRSGGPGTAPVLSANGNWQWAIDVLPDPFSSSVAVEIGVQLDQLTGITPGDTGVWDTSNPGTTVAGLTTAFDYTGGDADGFQSDTGNAEVYISVGSSVFGASSEAERLVTIEAGPPSDPGGLSTSLDIIGAYGIDGISTPGTNAIVAQQTADDPEIVITTVAVAPSEVRTATPGDTDLDGDIDPTDLAQIGLHWDPAGNNNNTWNDGNFDPADDTNVDPTDLATIGLNWNPSGAGITPPGSGGGSSTGVIPEPASALLMLLGAGLTALAGRRR